MEINITWNICRVCLVEEPKKHQGLAAGEESIMRHLFNEDKMLAKQIYECSGIMMKPNDSLPEKICKKCFAMVKQAMSFRKNCRSSDAFLQSVLQRTKSTSILFKPERPQLEDFEEDIITHENIEDDENVNTVEAPSPVKKEENKRSPTPLEHTPKKLRKDSLTNETNSNTDDLIAHEVEEEEMTEQDLNNIVEMEEILQPNVTEENHMLKAEKGDNSLNTNINDKQTENKPKAKGLKDNPPQKLQDFQNDEVIAEKDLSEMEEENSAETNNQGFFILKHIKDENETKLHEADDDVEEEQQEEHIETDEQEDQESVQFLPLEDEQEEGECQQLMLHSDSDMEDNQAQVSSTVITKQEEEEEEAEAGFIELQETNSNLSNASHDLSTEYIVDEYLIDDSNSNISSQNSGVVVVNSKISKFVTTTSKKRQANLDNKDSPQQPQVFVCDLCGNNFASRQLINAHMKVHRQEKNHQCELCFKRFITACNLQAHMRIHTGEKPFECQYCGRRFSDRSSNLRHERTHTNEKPYHCNECGKSFSLATTLKKHQKVHTGERSYRCEPCAKSFKLPHQLKAHKNTTLHRAVEQLGLLSN
ncbi:zinc finger protein with KRAB and SCAN domains 8-like [Lucilia sericata]|uniref:zinc finger protein with KRAB and SCAN domains 8-like n=1 Tax=Lucilia sericata TaxID=13632 RepID=UPI0018A7F867|nr:zinc finger protein with KRAB and SCAN domains 8-like [Lucilia sericata]